MLEGRSEKMIVLKYILAILLVPFYPILKRLLKDEMKERVAIGETMSVVLDNPKTGKHVVN